ncbi:MAG: penicillin-binding protein 2 [Thermodesulfovibrionales bacterium]
MLIEKSGSEKIFGAAVLVVLGFAVLVLRLWQLQVLQGEEYRRISEANRLRIIGVAAPRGIIFDRNRIPLVKNSPYFCASVIPQEFDRSLIPGLADLLKMPVEELTTRITRKSQSPFTPVRLKEGLTFPEVSYIEARRSDFPGLLIDIEVSRYYIYGSVGAHIIGYLGKPTPAQLKDPAFRDVPPDAFIGQWGVEKLFDRTLRGTAGQRIIEVDAAGREIRLIQENPPVKGADLVLSIDLALQKEAEAGFEGRAGALVALKPDTGEVIGLVSAPSFDPNRFSTGITPADWNDLMTDKKLPMLNRAIQSQYPPGSTFKIVDAIAALENKAIDTATRFNCSGGIGYGKWHFGCWKKGGHGGVNLHRGIVESCDVFFYETGRRLGFDKIHDYALALGLGAETGIPIGTEKKGLIPNEAWKKAVKKESWMLGETFINSIGQGYVSATPVQMAVMMSAVANGGSVYRPLILKDEKPALVRKAAISDETLEAVRNGLRGVVNEPGGTAQSSRSAKTVIAGKTGTAQVVGIRKDSKHLAEKFRDHAWFVAYAPFEKPEIAISVFVEHGGHGGSAAAPIAKKAIEAYLLDEKEKKELLDVQD